MKRNCLLIYATCFAMLIFSLAWAQDQWYTANQYPIAWDPVLAYVKNGVVEPLPEGDIILYNVYVKNADGMITKVASEIADTQLTITLPDEGKYIPGVETVRYPAGELTPVKSITISWADDINVVATDTFGIVMWYMPSVVTGLRPGS